MVIVRFERRLVALWRLSAVWGGSPWLPKNDDRPLTEKVTRLIQPLSSESPRWVVDSFQADEQLLEASDLGRPLRVIQLTRDVRAWVHSKFLAAEFCAGQKSWSRFAVIFCDGGG